MPTIKAFKKIMHLQETVALPKCYPWDVLYEMMRYFWQEGKGLTFCEPEQSILTAGGIF